MITVPKWNYENKNKKGSEKGTSEKIKELCQQRFKSSNKHITLIENDAPTIYVRQASIETNGK